MAKLGVYKDSPVESPHRRHLSSGSYGGVFYKGYSAQCWGANYLRMEDFITGQQEDILPPQSYQYPMQAGSSALVR